jgi:signal transduction histidine kinase
MLDAMPWIGAAEGAGSNPGSTTAAGRLRSSAILSDPRSRHVLGVVVLALLYRGVAQIGYALQFAGPVAAIVWLPVGIGIAFLYLGGIRYWPGVLVGDLLANDYQALPLGSALGQTCGNVLEIVVATLLLRKLVPRGDPLGTIGGVGGMLVAIGAATLVSATIGSFSLWLGDVVASGAVPRVWRTWWLGDATGALVVLPLALAWARPPPASWWHRRGAEAAAVLVALVVLSELALRTSRPLTYLVFPALIWAALRLGRHGATVAIAVAACFAIWETTREVGPFVYQSAMYSVLSTQLYIGVAALSTLFLSAVVSERERATERLATSRARLVETADRERRRIEQNLHDGAQQRLTALAVRLSMSAERARSAPESSAGMLEAAQDELILAIDELRELAHGIHPSTLTELGLADSLRGMAARSTIPIRLLELPSVRLDTTAESTAYFVVSEAITNARKHSDASWLSVRATASRGILRLEVADNGVGGASMQRGSGLQGLRDRVEAIGGTLGLVSPEGGGTRLLVELPATRPTA